MADDESPPPVASGEPLPDDEARKRKVAEADDAAIAAAFLLWRFASPRALVELWRAARDPEDGPFRGGGVWRWLLRTRRFQRNAFGSAPLPRPDVRAAVDDVISESESRAESAGTPLKSGEIGVSAWQSRMEEVARDAIVAAAVIGSGGVRSFGAAERRLAERLVRFHHDKLAGFAAEVAGGMPLDGSFDARARMYGAAGTGGYEAALRLGDIDAGFRWERRVLNARQSCAECRSYAAQGWRRVGELPALGDRCSCKSNCKCTFERSRSLRYPGDFAMPETERLQSRDECRRRTRLAAKQGFEAARVQFAGVSPPDGPQNGTLVRAKGTLPKSEDDALSRINGILGLSGSKALTEDQVYIRYLEAASTNFIPTRTMFLGKSTLANVANRAADGFAFMNSHRTGGMSAPAELPYGRTFGGRLETYALPGGKEWTRAVVGFYMLRGQHPNGVASPSTDDLVAGIDGGTIFDVSLGLYMGRSVCDVCKNELRSADCGHIPGTTRNMSKDQVKARIAEGIPGGVATYTLEDAEPGEVSAVFDGAVPGAGFRRFRSFARAHLLTAHQLEEARLAYGHLLDAPRHSDRSRRMPQKVSRNKILAALGLGSDDGDDHDDIDLELGNDGDPVAKPSAASAAATAELQNKIKALSDQLAASEARRAEAEAKAEADRRDAKFSADAKDFVAGHKAANRLTAKQAADVEKLHARLAADDHASPVQGFSRVACLSAVLADAKPFGKSEDAVPNQAGTLLANEGDSTFDPAEYARQQNRKHLGNPSKSG